MTTDSTWSVYPCWLLVHPDDVSRLDDETIEVVAGARFVMGRNYRSRQYLPVFTGRERAIAFVESTPQVGVPAIVSARDPADFLEWLDGCRGIAEEVTINPTGGDDRVASSIPFDDFYNRIK